MRFLNRVCRLNELVAKGDLKNIYIYISHMHPLTLTPIDKLDKPTNRRRFGFVGLSSLSTGVVSDGMYTDEQHNCGSWAANVEHKATCCRTSLLTRASLMCRALHFQGEQRATSANTNAFTARPTRLALMGLEVSLFSKSKVLTGPTSRGAKRRGNRLVLGNARGLYFNGSDR